MKYRIENYAETFHFDNSKCYVSYNWWTGFTCTGWSCASSSGNSCLDSYTYNDITNSKTGSFSSGLSSSRMCLKIECKNSVLNCYADRIGVDFYISSSAALTTCDASTPPTNGGVGDCTSSLASGSTCRPTCNSGYTVSGVSSCSAGTLTAATCIASSAAQCLTSGTCSSSASTRFDSSSIISSGGYTYQCCVSNGKFCLSTASLASCPETTCDASTPPTNGGIGDCTSSLTRGATCQPTCNSGYKISGTSACDAAGRLNAATCIKNTCDASTPPTNGGVGDCTSSLAGGSTCQPTCNSGYTVSGVSSCTVATSSIVSAFTSATCIASSSSNDCQCSCCTGSFCRPSVVGLFNAGSSAACSGNACRTQFSSSCPASGTSGSISVTYFSSSSSSGSLTALTTDIGTLPAGEGGVSDSVTGYNCLRFKTTLTAATSKLIVAGFTQANLDAILAAEPFYATMDAAVNDIKSKAVSTSLCDFADFNDGECEKVVLLDASRTYRLGALNTGASPIAYTYSVYECTASESAGSSLGSTSGASRLAHTFTLAALIAGALTLF